MFNQPTVKEVGIVAIRGQDYHCQTISYGSRRQVYVFRKGQLHKHGMVFETEAEYNYWRRNLGRQLDLFNQD
jgi:hypothetical protein